jgi:hypothetical protein
VLVVSAIGCFLLLNGTVSHKRSAAAPLRHTTAFAHALVGEPDSLRRDPR